MTQGNSNLPEPLREKFDWIISTLAKIGDHEGAEEVSRDASTAERLAAEYPGIFERIVP